MYICLTRFIRVSKCHGFLRKRQNDSIDIVDKSITDTVARRSPGRGKMIDIATFLSSDFRGREEAIKS